MKKYLISYYFSGKSGGHGHGSAVLSTRTINEKDILAICKDIERNRKYKSVVLLNIIKLPIK